MIDISSAITNVLNKISDVSPGFFIGIITVLIIQSLGYYFGSSVGTATKSKELERLRTYLANRESSNEKSELGVSHDSD